MLPVLQMGRKCMNMSGISVHSIGDCLRTAASLFDLTKTRKTLGIVVRDLKEISYNCTITRLHLRANKVNSGLVSVYVYGNSTPQPSRKTKL